MVKKKELRTCDEAWEGNGGLRGLGQRPAEAHRERKEENDYSHLSVSAGDWF